MLAGNPKAGKFSKVGGERVNLSRRGDKFALMETQSWSVTVTPGMAPGVRAYLCAA
jgi:hypothetical protein